jgi:hypothetical protein
MQRAARDPTHCAAYAAWIHAPYATQRLGVCLLSLQEQADQSARNSDQGVFFQGLSPYGDELYYPPEVRMVRGAHILRPVGAGTGRD